MNLYQYYMLQSCRFKLADDHQTSLMYKQAAEEIKIGG